jgi:putative transposase
MPWKFTRKEEQRFDLVRQMMAGELSVSELCRRFKISRQTAYKWHNLYRRGRLEGLRDRSRRPRHFARLVSLLWRRRLRRWRERHPSWGGRKLRHELVRRFGADKAPSVASITRWLQRWGLSRGRPRRRSGPRVRRHPLRQAARCHEVWTVDFKGWFYTGDGTRVEPLTVRDLYSRYGLAIVLLRKQSIAQTRAAFEQIFAEHGLPRCIRCDNGSPFGAGIYSGLTRLSVWWVKLGIKVDFITPGRPCENGAHEQFHGVYKAEVAADPAATPADQQSKSNHWLRLYNQKRPHEALNMKRPVELFRKNRRKMPAVLKPWKYPARWERRRVKANGEISWRGQDRYVGQAFAAEDVALKPLPGKRWRIYLGPIMVGELREKERGSIRLARYGRGG